MAFSVASVPYGAVCLSIAIRQRMFKPMARLSPDDWIRAASRTLAEDGVEAVRVEVLARDLGVSKGSFYWHFKNRAALLEAVLDGWEAGATDAIIEAVNERERDPGARLWALMETVFARSSRGHAFEAGVRMWATRAGDVAKRVRHVDKRRVRFVCGLLIEAGLPRADAKIRATLLYRALIGEYLMGEYDAPRSKRRDLKAMYALLLRDAENGSGPAC